MSRRADLRLQPELMDAVSLSAEESARALADLDRINRWLFATWPVNRTLLARLAAGPRRQKLLDLGAGSGQIPDRLARAARRRDIELALVSVDRKLSHLLEGRRRGLEQARVLAAADALPFRDGAVDWTMSTLFFHHFGPAENRRILEQMLRVARRGATVIDLRRSRLAALLLRLLLPLLGAGEVALADGRLSVAQAWSLAEVAEWLEDRPGVELRRRFPFRFCLVVARAPGAGDAPAGPAPTP